MGGEGVKYLRVTQRLRAESYDFIQRCCFQLGLDVCCWLSRRLDPDIWSCKKRSVLESDCNVFLGVEVD